MPHVQDSHTINFNEFIDTHTNITVLSLIDPNLFYELEYNAEQKRGSAFLNENITRLKVRHDRTKWALLDWQFANIQFLRLKVCWPTIRCTYSQKLWILLSITTNWMKPHWIATTRSKHSKTDQRWLIFSKPLGQIIYICFFPTSCSLIVGIYLVDRNERCNIADKDKRVRRKKLLRFANDPSVAEGTK